MSEPSVVVVNGRPVPDGVWTGGSWHRIPCTCGYDAPDEKCPYHGRHPFMVCEDCNYERHQCPGCGEPLEHGVGACDDCLADLDEERAVTRAATTGPHS
jgi:hypothetical protein